MSEKPRDRRRRLRILNSTIRSCSFVDDNGAVGDPTEFRVPYVLYETARSRIELVPRLYPVNNAERLRPATRCFHSPKWRRTRPPRVSKANSFEFRFSRTNRYVWLRHRRPFVRRTRTVHGDSGRLPIGVGARDKNAVRMERISENCGNWIFERKTKNS